MPKKRNNASPRFEEPLSKMQKVLKFVTDLREIIVILASVFLWLLGVWLTGKLAPINQSIESLKVKAESNESSITKIETSLNEIKQTDKDQSEKIDKINQDTSYIRGILDTKR